MKLRVPNRCSPGSGSRERAERALALLLKRPDLADAVPEAALAALSEHRSEAGQLLAELLTILSRAPAYRPPHCLGAMWGPPLMSVC